MKFHVFHRKFFLIFLIGGLHLQHTSGQELSDFMNLGLRDKVETVEPYYDYEYIPDFTYNEVEKRVKGMKTDMPFELNETIFAFVNYFTVRNREYTRMVLARKEIYFPLFEEALKDHNMPEDIKFLSIIESGLNPRARSRVGAMGLWQFMPGTGREYKLYVNEYIDDRMDPEMSTEAALLYLKALYRRFGDWELALAAYNCGPGNVNKAIRRSGGKKTFWEIYNYLPRETRSYIPQFQAIMYVLRHPELHNFVLEEPTYPIPFEKITLNEGYDLENFAKITDICIEDLEHLNPSILNRQIPGFKKNMALRIPRNKISYITENQEWIIDSLRLEAERFLAENKPAPRQEDISQPMHTLTYRVKPGDVLGKIAQQYNVPLTQLKSWNNLSSNMIRVGQVLHIYQDNASFEKNLANNTRSNNSVSESGDNKTYTVQPGDSLWLISKKLNGVTIEQLKKLNNLNNNQIKPGQKLIIG
ncbi:lytic transglycosylase domain-containing protein [Negadavirga shengliensis]|uniref:LysM peptidoglycan-binding domain-containing protein n=1 Tax=Negadavirga shengliensis TaxID=1389218 RepID=A0ABV9T4K0_9BACT